MRKLALALVLTIVAVVPARAQFVVPTSYTATPGGVGGFTYFDDTGSQLTDGIYGVDDYTADLGNGNAYEWVGWTDPNPTITFNFPSSITVQSVLIDFNRNEGAGIYLPANVTIGGTVFNLNGDEIDFGTRGTLIYNGSWTGSSLQVDLTANGSYTFVDEMKFSTAVVPEPGLTAAFIGAAALAWATWRRRGDSRG
jgi:hypothetical protein